VVRSPLQICLRCVHLDTPCDGRCACKADPKQHDVRDIAKQRDCPLGFHKEAGIGCSRCGGAHDVSACQIPENFDIEQEKRRAQQGGCCH
jgi:hypothetical protein